MEQNARRRIRNDALPSTRSPARHIRNKSSQTAQSMTPPTSASSRTPTTHDGSDQSSAQLGRKSMEDEKRHFIGNVGSGGKLYLAPSRMPHQVNIFPATPPATAHGESAWPIRQSTASGAWTPRSRGAAVPVPPMSLANAARRTRSRSVSTIGTPKETQDMERSKSSMEMTDGLLNLRIPHYRLGTPGFSDEGSAYLRSSILTNSTDDRSSVLSQSAYDRLFPLPPARSATGQGAPHHLHPSAAYDARLSLRRAPRPASTLRKREPEDVFDEMERNPNDAAVVRLSPHGQLLAATIPRLIVQITSPRFLDYELLSDFFLTYRGFLKSHELLDWLLLRMRWAIKNISDAGRIVRVRTFVALRHWVLNYFADDFAPSLELRQLFCEHVNRLSDELRQRKDGVVGDLNILEELKKCWRRTSALFWPTLDDFGAEDITPGGVRSGIDKDNKESSPARAAKGDFLLAAQIFAVDQRTNQKARVVSMNSMGSTMLMQRGSIPASPMSEDSLHVLSCSVPFLRRPRPDANAEKRAEKSAPRPVMSQRRTSLTRQRNTQHRRTESDTVLSRRPMSDASESVDIDQLPTITLTGGLVRGILLQPSPPTLQRHTPRSPPVEDLTQTGDSYFEEQHMGVKRIVGDMRRALSVKKSASEHSGRSGHSARSGSRGSNHLREDAPRSVPQENKASSSGPRRDVLAARLQKSYQKHFMQTNVTPQGDFVNRVAQGGRGTAKPLSVGEFGNRLNSRISTSSRSIVIIDATSRPASPARVEGFTEHIAVMPLFPGIMDAQRSSDIRAEGAASRQTSFTSEQTSQSIDERLHESLILSPAQRKDDYDTVHLRKSSDVHGPQVREMRSIPNQLRRRPGGDLKAADHVHQLEPEKEASSPVEPQEASSTQVSSHEHKTSHSSVARIRRSAIDRTSSQPHVRPSFRPEAHRLAKVRTESQSSGGIEDTLARLEGKSSSRKRRSGMSWLELPSNEETTASTTNNQSAPTEFEMISSSTQTYRVSQPDISEENSSINAESKVPATYVPTRALVDRASSLPVDFDNNAIHVTSGREHKKDLSTSTIQSSFLLDDNQSLSDISTDIAENTDDDSAGVRSFFFDDTADHDDDSAYRIPRPIFSPDSEHSQFSVPDEISRPAALKIATNAARILGVPAGSLMAEVMQTRPNQRKADDEGHFPFVLAFESKVVAEQLCIIEKDALDEVDWKDLIALNWQQTPTNVRNWADYLKQDSSNGIDLVVARFNLVVKWVVSECVLTESIIERARCITKYIHIAMHCLRLRNYASMAQITLALLSSDLARLQRTWAFVLPVDKGILNHLETLCQPLRNFQNLRAEMESASLNDGCIPFIGLYTHDLMYNAQKPAWLDSATLGNASSTLVNFERYQTAATVTKSLLRLLDASARYVFRPHPEALSRCLWLAALDDADIRDISMDIE